MFLFRVVYAQRCSHARTHAQHTAHARAHAHTHTHTHTHTRTHARTRAQAWNRAQQTFSVYTVYSDYFPPAGNYYTHPNTTLPVLNLSYAFSLLFFSLVYCLKMLTMENVPNIFLIPCGYCLVPGSRPPGGDMLCGAGIRS